MKKPETPMQARRRMIQAAENVAIAGQDGVEPWEETTSFHEAGHAVAAAALEVPFDYVTIEPNEESDHPHIQYGYKLLDLPVPFPCRRSEATGHVVGAGWR